MKRVKLLAVIALVLMFTQAAHALDPVPQESSFSGFVRAGAVVLTVY